MVLSHDHMDYLHRLVLLSDLCYCCASRHQLNRNMNPAGLEEELLLNVMRDELMTHPCKNQGYVLEDFPQTREQAKELFDGESDTPRLLHVRASPAHSVFSSPGKEEDATSQNSLTSIIPGTCREL